MTVASNDIELRTQRKITLAFIASAPVRVQLVRVPVEREEDRGGLRRLAPVTLDFQTFRINHAPPRRRRKENQPPNETLGEIPFAKDNLMCRWDADIEEQDKFTWLGVEYTVTYVFHDRAYEIIANLATSDQ